MTPKEIVDEVRKRNDEGRGCSAFSEHECAHIDHLLAIHAAVVEMLDARHEANTMHDIEVMIRASDRQAEATNKLADLCGWKEEGT